MNSIIGSEQGAAIAKKADAEGLPSIDRVEKRTDLPRAELLKLLDPAEVSQLGIKGGTRGGG